MSREEILKQLVSGKIKIEEASTLLAAQEQRGGGVFTMKVSEKGAITFRGVPGTHHQFGLSLYAKGVQFLLAHAKEIEKFIETNKGKLSWEKADKDKAAKAAA